jgi:cytochrome d ubiquinol oxidase subunit I
MSFEFGTNWSLFSAKSGNIIGPLLGFEVLTAFFLEASFLGVMLFGWNRVSPKMHFAATIIVAVGTLISAFWILSANSWMQTPQGVRMGQDGLFYPVSWLKIIFSPSFPYRFMHMITAAYLTTSFAVGAVGAFYLLRKVHVRHARIMFGMAMIMAIFVAPFQLLVGDMHGLNTLKHQPVKIAAMEGLWETRQGAPWTIFGWPDQKAEVTRHAIEIPKLGSLILTHSFNGEVKGLKDWPRDERPPVAMVFWAFRIMFFSGCLMILTGLIALVLYLKKILFESRWFHYGCIAMGPTGFISVLAGWFVTEVGRQPYMVYGLLRTADTASPLSAPPILISLTAFVCTYAFIFGAGIFYILRLIGKGPVTPENAAYGDHGVKPPILAPGQDSKKGGIHA